MAEQIRLINENQYLLTAISKDLILKDDAYSQFVGYTKAFAELGLITNEDAKNYRIQLGKILF